MESNNQNFICIVYHDVKLPPHHRHRLKICLKQIFHYIRIFTDISSFSECLTQPFIVNKLVIIVNGKNTKYLCENIENDKEDLKDPLVYELQFDSTLIESSLPVDKRFYSINKLMNKIDADMKAYISTITQADHQLDLEQEPFPLGIHELLGKQRSFCYLSREELKFILFQSFIEILLSIKYDDKSEEDEALIQMWTSCRADADNQNKSDLQKIDEYQEKYSSTHPIDIYTNASFFFRTVNKILRYEDLERIFDFQPFIAHIHKQLQNLRKEQQSQITCSQQIFRRGKKLPMSVLQQLEDNKGKFISINGFLSTTKSDEVADIYAGKTTNLQGYESVIFEMYVDEMIDTKRPYADVSRVSTVPDDDEVLFFMGFVWRIEEVNQQDDQTWKVKLQLAIDMDLALTKSFNELADKCTFFQLGKILHELGEYKKAINFYDRMLDLKPKLSDKKLVADIYFHMAISALEDESYSEALTHILKSEHLINEITNLHDGHSIELQPILAEDISFSRIRILINKGLIYRKKKNYQCAKQSFNQALQEHGSKNDKAYAYYHLGVLEYERGVKDASKHFSDALCLTTDETLKNAINQKLRILNEISPIRCDHQKELIIN